MKFENRNVEIRTDKKICVDAYIDLLIRSGLSERRPIHDIKTMNGIVNNTDILVTAWVDHLLIGLSRSLTDFSFSCYLADLAVDIDYQKMGIGKELVDATKLLLPAGCTLLLLSAPLANDYYKKIGFENHDRCWYLTI